MSNAIAEFGAALIVFGMGLALCIACGLFFTVLLETMDLRKIRRSIFGKKS